MLISQLDQTAALMSVSVDKINHGGCCVVAGIVGKQLRSHVDDMKVLILSAGSRTLKEAREITMDHLADATSALDLMDVGGLRVTHAVIEFEVDGVVTYFDVDTGVFGSIEAMYDAYNWEVDVVGEITVDEANQWGSEAAAWNTTFDRGAIPILEDIADQLLAA